MRPFRNTSDTNSPAELDIETREADMEAPPQGIVRQGTFASFRHKDYTLFWLGSLLSNTGSWMQNYALAIVVYSFRSSELDLGLVNFLTGIPILVLSLPAGAIADRFDRRRMLIAAQSVLLVQAALLGGLYATGHLSSERAVPSLVWVAGLGLAAGVASALTFPAWQAMMPDLVPRENLLNGIALNSAQFQSARLLGPLAASALLLAGLGIAEIFYANAVSFVFVIAALAAIRVRFAQETRPAAPASQGPHERGRAWSTLTAGLRYARENRAIGVLIGGTALMTVFGMPYMMLLPAIVDKSLGGGKLEVSYVMAANGLGALVGSLLVASLPRSARRERLIPMGLVAFGCLLAGFGLSRSLPLSLVLSTFAGAALLTVNSLVNTSIQSSVPPQLRGRVMALFVMAFMGLMPVSSIIFGPIAQAVGPGKAVFGGALVVLAWGLLLVSKPSLLARLDEDRTAI